MKSIIIKVLAGLFLFSSGAAAAVPVCRMYDTAHTAREATVSAGLEDPVENDIADVTERELQLRVRDGNLEWFDGVRWNDAGSVEELVEADIIAQPSETWQAWAAQLAEARAGEYSAKQEALSRDHGSLSVDEIVIERPQTVTRPAASMTAQPTTSAQQAVPVTSVPDDDDDDDQYEEPAPAPEPEPEPAPAPEPDDTGDGENIEWSGDYE